MKQFNIISDRQEYYLTDGKTMVNLYTGEASLYDGTGKIELSNMQLNLDNVEECINFLIVYNQLRQLWSKELHYVLDFVDMPTMQIKNAKLEDLVQIPFKTLYITTDKNKLCTVYWNNEYARTIISILYQNFKQ